MSKSTSLLLFATIFACQWVHAASAATPVYDTPIYDPAAKSYFVLVNARAPGSPYPRNEGFEWGEANIQAESSVFKGVHGRLAVVDSLEIHSFLLSRFHPDVEAWIGLRYLCTTHRLLWSDGQFMNAHSFKAWNERWDQDVYGCRSESVPQYLYHGEQYMPVAYSKQPNFTWVAKGWKKRYLLYFVEFPTGHP